MGFFKKLFSPSTSEPSTERIESYDDFWAWFRTRERDFYTVVSERGEFVRDFFDHVNPRLNQLKDGLYLLAGMVDKATAELVITPDGDVKNIVFAEELVAAAPNIEGWKFTALKPSAGESFSLRKGDIVIESDKLFFYPSEIWERPDDVNISIVHHAVSKGNRDEMSHAINLFLDNYLGELDFVTQIDNLDIVGEAAHDVQPLAELKDYLQIRQNGFREKYEGQRANTEEDPHASFEGETENGFPLIAIVNQSLLTWGQKASHPWIAIVEFGFSAEENGLPDSETYDQLDSIEEEMMIDLRDVDGYLNVGRQTGEGVRTVFFACKDFRLPSKVFHSTQKRYVNEFEINFGIYKDKYWETFDRFVTTGESDLPS